MVGIVPRDATAATTRAASCLMDTVVGAAHQATWDRLAVQVISLTPTSFSIGPSAENDHLQKSQTYAAV